MANATNTQVGRSVGHDRAVLVATSGQFCWPPTGSSNWPLTLARAHARSGDPVPIATYLGLSGKADRAFADFAVAYAQQATNDYAGFVGAIKSGRLVSA